MADKVTSYESWTNRPVAPKGDLCWSCKTGTYLVYDSDATQTPRCGQCGELEQDKPAKPVPVATKRRATKTTKE